MVIDMGVRVPSAHGSAAKSTAARDWQVRSFPLPFRTEADRYYELLALDASDLERALVAEIEEEHGQPEAKRYRSALARLTAWLELDHEDARILAGAWDRALRTLPDSVVRGMVEAERGAILNGMSFESFSQLSNVLPWLRDEVSARDREVLAAAA